MTNPALKNKRRVVMGVCFSLDRTCDRRLGNERIEEDAVGRTIGWRKKMRKGIGSLSHREIGID